MTFFKHSAIAAVLMTVSAFPASATILDFSFSDSQGYLETFQLDTTAGQQSPNNGSYVYATINDNKGNTGVFFGSSQTSGYSGTGTLSGNLVDPVAVNSFFNPAIYRGTGPIAFAPGQSFTGSAQTTFAVSSAVPEPATWALMTLGLGGLGAMIRRRRLVTA